MSDSQPAMNEKQRLVRRAPRRIAQAREPTPHRAPLRQRLGNRTISRLIAQRSAAGGFDLDDATAQRINRARSGGRALGGALQAQMGDAMGHDFSGVRVHTGSESDALNAQLSARAFTTGQDIFVRSGDYTPGSSGGQRLLAHELSHVVQQAQGRVPGGSGAMTVRPAGDVFEREADAVASQAMHAPQAAGPAPEGGVQRQELPEEDELQMKAVQRQDDLEDEELQTMALQRQDDWEDEDELQTKALQRQEDWEDEDDYA